MKDLYTDFETLNDRHDESGHIFYRKVNAQTGQTEWVIARFAWNKDSVENITEIMAQGFIRKRELNGYSYTRIANHFNTELINARIARHLLIDLRTAEELVAEYQAKSEVTDSYTLANNL